MELGRHARLTRRERQVVVALLQGRSVSSTAESLGIRVSTVRGHIRAIHLKTETHTLIELILWAAKHHDCCKPQQS